MHDHSHAEEICAHLFFQHLEIIGKSDSVPLPVVLIISYLSSKRKRILHSSFTTLTSIGSKMTDAEEAEAGHLHPEVILMLWLVLTSAQFLQLGQQMWWLT